MTPTSPEEDSAQFYHPLSELLSEGQLSPLSLNPGDPDLSVVRSVFPGPDGVKDLLIEGWVWREGVAIPSAEAASNRA
jgi:hypothetical protein